MGSATWAEGAGRARPRPWGAVPFAVFAVLYALTYKRWIFPFQDHGREMEVPLRILNGEALYRDVGLPFGPLPAHLDAAALALFGRSLDALIAVRTALALLGVAALYRLARRLAPGDAAPAALTSFAVAAVFFGYGSAWPFPYSGAALAGTVGTWWALELALAARSSAAALAAGLVGGLAAGTKVEIAPAALLAVGLGLLASRGRRGALPGAALAGLLAAAAWGVPVLLYGRGTLERHGYLIALHNPPGWRRLQLETFTGGLVTRDHPLARAALAYLPSVLFLGAALLLLALVNDSRRARWGAVALGLLGALIPRNDELHALLPLALALGLLAVLRAATRRSPGDLALAAIALPMLLALWRQPFFLRVPVYSAFAAPLALVFALALLSRLPRLPPALLACFVAGLALAQGVDRLRDRRALPLTWVSFPHASLYVPSETVPLLVSAVHTLETVTRPGARIAVLPEGGLLHFTTGRGSAFVDAQFFPGTQDAESEREMIRRLDERPPAAVLVTNQTLLAFGEGEYRRGVLDAFFRALDRRMVAAAVLGTPDVPIVRLGTATSGVLYLPLPGASAP